MAITGTSQSIVNIIVPANHRVFVYSLIRTVWSLVQIEIFV